MISGEVGRISISRLQARKEERELIFWTYVVILRD